MSSPSRPNPFFSTTAKFFAPSVGDRVDKAIADTKSLAHDAQSKTSELYGKLDTKLQDAKEAAKHSVQNHPTGIDLYSR
jgi:solute carrier family 25 phosphate transporter 3